VKIYVATVEALREKERQGETQCVDARLLMTESWGKGN
jgi:hypothetical protein